MSERSVSSFAAGSILRLRKVEQASMMDAVTRDAGMLAEVEHPTFGTHRRLAPVVTPSSTPGEARPASTLGMNSEPALRELGYDDAAIASLVERGVVARGN